MFLTRMYLNPTRITTKRLLSSPQVAHALVQGSIPPGSEPGRVLWRLDVDQQRLALYVMSPGRPDLTGVVEQAGWPTEATWETRHYDPFLARLAPGQLWRFRLTANPTRSTARGLGERGKVRPHRTVDHQLGWLLERAARLGVCFPANHLGAAQVGVHRRDARSFARHSGQSAESRTDRVELTVVTYEGVLRVDDPELLRQALIRGVGRAKGYGCGLLTLAEP